MSYLSYYKFGRTEFYMKVRAKDKLQDTNIVKVNIPQHEHVTQIKAISDKLKETDAKV